MQSDNLSAYDDKAEFQEFVSTALKPTLTGIFDSYCQPLPATDGVVAP